MLDTSHMMRHVGKMANTDQRIVVVFMQLPQRPDHALVVPVDNLPQRFEQAVMDVLKTPEGQQAMPFADALHRHRMPESGETILEALHKQGKLVAVPVTNILMLPSPNQPIRLSDILDEQGLLPQNVAKNFESDKFNPHTYNQKVDISEAAREGARGLLIDAEMLEAEGRKKREAAYAKDPSLRANAAAPTKVSGNPWSASLAETPIFPLSTAQAAEGLTRSDTNYTIPVEISSFDNRLSKLEGAIDRLIQMMPQPDAPESVVKSPESE